MNHQCTRCSHAMEAAWTYCPNCGVPAVAGQKQAIARVESTPERHSAPYRGLIYGGLVALALIAVGVVLCLLDWGLFVGSILILVGVFTPLVLFSIGEQQGRCPHCRVRVITGPDHKLHACPHCNMPFAVDERHAVPTA